jgi:hypothetical protein
MHSALIIQSGTFLHPLFRPAESGNVVSSSAVRADWNEVWWQGWPTFHPYAGISETAFVLWALTEFFAIFHNKTAMSLPILYCHVSRFCVTNKMGLGFDDRIYWAFIQLFTTVHKSLTCHLPTGHSKGTDFQPNCQLLMASLYIVSRWIHRKHLLEHLFSCWLRVLQVLPNNGSTLLLVAYLLAELLPSNGHMHYNMFIPIHQTDLHKI